MLDPINDLIGDQGFRTGLLVGLAAAAVVGVGALIARPARPWAGVAFGVAAVLALSARLDAADHVPVTTRLVVGLALLAAAGLVAGRQAALRLVAAVPGAAVVAGSTEIDDPGWAMPTIAVATVVGGVLAAEFDRSWARRGLPPVLLAVTVLGVYVTTPDTEHARILAGAALAVAPLGWPRPLASLGSAGSLVAVALVSWTAVVDGLARPGAIVGAVACVGVLALEPAVRWTAGRLAASTASGRVRPRAAPLPSWGEAVAVVAVHVGLVAVCSRVAGMRTAAAEALAISAVAYAVAAGALVAAMWWAGRPAP